jgi:hypothetical protein
MADVIDFEEFKVIKRKRDRFSTWFSRLGYLPDPDFTIKDLPDHVLLSLAEAGCPGNALLDELILNVWGEPHRDSRSLPLVKRMRLIDVSLFLIDNFRFECMFRLGWVEEFQARSIPISQLIIMGEQERKPLKVVPRLTQRHPHHQRFVKMMERERDGFLRRMIPSALEQFRSRVKKERDPDPKRP